MMIAAMKTRLVFRIGKDNVDAYLEENEHGVIMMLIMVFRPWENELRGMIVMLVVFRLRKMSRR
jgi:hypothetical protein